jgi:hypothetical protein
MPTGTGAADGPTGGVRALIVDPRYNGPVGWANGGYACGLIADAVGRELPDDRTIQVTLRRPVPLGAPLRVEQAVGEPGGRVWHGDELVASAEPTALRSSLPPVSPDISTARRAGDRHPGWPTDGPLADCFVCSRRRPDGLQVVAGPLDEPPTITATPFEPARCSTVIADDGLVRPEIIWAALDCPSFPVGALLTGRICLLGTFSVRRNREIGLDVPLVVVGWVREQERRVSRTASAMLDAAGTVVAEARATWIELKDQPLPA